MNCGAVSERREEEATVEANGHGEYTEEAKVESTRKSSGEKGECKNASCIFLKK